MRLRELLIENLNQADESKTAVLGWGRGMGHKGHMLLAQAVIHHAEQINAEPFFVVSRTTLIDPDTGDVWADRKKVNTSKDDPLTPDEKIATYKKVFPDQSHIFSVATEDASTLLQVIAKLSRQGFKNIVLVVGEKEVAGFSYLSNPDKSGTSPMQQVGVDTLKIISRQETNAPGSDVSKPDYQEGPRATPLRQVLLDPNESEEEQFAIWRDAMPDKLSDEEVMDLMQKAKDRLVKANTPVVRGKKEVATAEERVELVKSMEWPDFINKLSSAMKATGWKGKRKSDDAFLFSVAGPDDDVWYMVIVENVGNGNFSYALGTVEEGDPYIDDAYKGQMPTTEASLSELIDMIRDGFGLNEEAAGVGIVTKQNTTADVGPGTLNKMLKAFKLK